MAALVEHIRQALERGESVHVPDLGTFSIEHRPSHVEKGPEGEQVMHPPRNTIVFTPDE